MKDVTHSLVLGMNLNVEEMTDADIEEILSALRKRIKRARTQAKDGTWTDGITVDKQPTKLSN